EADRLAHRQHVGDERQPLVERGAFAEHLLQRSPRDQLHHVERLAVGEAADLVNRHDAGVLEPRGDLRLALEADLLRRRDAPEELQRHDAAELAIAAADQASPAPAADLIAQLVALGVQLLERRRPGLFERVVGGTGLDRARHAYSILGWMSED